MFFKVQYKNYYQGLYMQHLVPEEIVYVIIPNCETHVNKNDNMYTVELDIMYMKVNNKNFIMQLT